MQVTTSVTLFFLELYLPKSVPRLTSEVKLLTEPWTWTRLDSLKTFGTIQYTHRFSQQILRKQTSSPTSLHALLVHNIKSCSVHAWNSSCPLLCFYLIQGTPHFLDVCLEIFSPSLLWLGSLPLPPGGFSVVVVVVGVSTDTPPSFVADWCMLLGC